MARKLKGDWKLSLDGQVLKGDGSFHWKTRMLKGDRGIQWMARKLRWGWELSLKEGGVGEIVVAYHRFRTF